MDFFNLKKRIKKETIINLKIKVSPGRDKTAFQEKLSDNTLKFSVAAVAEKNMANKEIISFFKKNLKPLKVEIAIVSGKRSKLKILKIEKL
jgi:uncharacterized protein YggU (UPF0235/DUF167 family)